MTIDVDLILNDLKVGKTKKTQDTLDKIHSILKEYTKQGKGDYSITTIGNILAKNGGPSYETIRATKNDHYRKLIETWAAYARSTLKIPSGNLRNSTNLPKDYELLEQISDITLRSIFGQIISEKNKYKKELGLLKNTIEITIDKRPIIKHGNSNIEQSFQNILTPSEIEALEYAISNKCMERNDWNYTNAGQVKNIEYGDEIYPRGYINAIKKILEKISN